MRFTIEKESLLKGLTLVAKAVPPKAELPILQNIKLSLTERGLEILGSDNNITIRTIVPYMIGEKEIIKNSENGETLIAAKILLEVVRHIEDEYITFDLIESSILMIEDNKSNFKLNSIRADEYPQINFEKKETRPILTAINLEAHDNLLTATATDTARLARKSVEIESDVRFVANIPAKKMSDIVRSFEDAEMVEIAVSDKKAIFSFNNTTISTRLTNGEYPNTKNIVPQNFNYFLEVNSSEFSKAMERVSLLSAEHDGVVKLIMTEDEVEIISRSSLVGSANETLNVFQFNGDRLEISFRSSFVADAIKACKSEDVTIAFIGEMKPFVVKNSKDDTIDMLVTPLRS